jgi:hypothetical protein
MKSGERSHVPTAIKVTPASKANTYLDLSEKKLNTARSHSIIYANKDEESYLGTSKNLNADRQLHFRS